MYRRTTWVKKGKKKVVWRCISRLEFGTKYCQHSPTISEEALHQAILQCIQKVVEDKEDILKNLRDVQENIILFSGNQITPQSLEKQIDKLQQEMSALVKIIAQGGDILQAHLTSKHHIRHRNTSTNKPCFISTMRKT